jgi:hypothetical protein
MATDIHWTQIAVPLPLGLGVPVLNVKTGDRGVVVGHYKGRVMVSIGGLHHMGAFDAEDGGDWTPDLDEPQGFGWALRELCLREPRRHAGLIERLQEVHGGWHGRHGVTMQHQVTLMAAWISVLP